MKVPKIWTFENKEVANDFKKYFKRKKLYFCRFRKK